jgi:signal transduction histidine kinase/DNA-binding response OmpR family regulator
MDKPEEIGSKMTEVKGDSESLTMNLTELQNSTLPLITGLLVILSIIVFLWVTNNQIQLQHQDDLGGIILLVALCSWLLRDHYPLGTWINALGISVIIMTAQLLIPGQSFNILFILPCILTMAYLGTLAGVGFGVFNAVLLLYCSSVNHTPPFSSSNVVAVGAIFGCIGLVWAALRPLNVVTKESWYHFTQAQALLEESRDRQLELNQAYEDLQNAYRELGRLNQLVITSEKTADEARHAKETFVANVSHELRTPLNMVIGFSSMIAQTPLKYRQKLPPQLLADIAAIQRNAEHLSKLVDDVLDLSKADSGYMKLNVTNNSVEDIIKQAVQSISSFFEMKGLWIKTQIDPRLPMVPCDLTRIRQVILNLLSNAGRFVDKGGVNITASVDNAEVVIGVTDTGPGIAAADIERLFEPFRQLETPYQENKGGTGLGLAISKKLVELHGGKMWLESALGAGSTFYFSLPIAIAAELGRRTSSWFSPYYVERMHSGAHKFHLPEIRPRILFVDPENTLYSMAASYLDKSIEVALARTIEEASADLMKSPAQALVINQPDDGNSLPLQEAIKELPYAIPTLVCSLPGTHSAARYLGVNQYLVKPISRETLLAAVQSLPKPVDSILIADDDHEAVQLFARMLGTSDKNYQLLRADDGRRALEIIRTVHPDLVLMDLLMPGLTGYQILSSMHAEPDLADIQVITVSAQDPPEESVSGHRVSLFRSSGFSSRDLLDVAYAVSNVLTPIWNTDDPGQIRTLLD